MKETLPNFNKRAFSLPQLVQRLKVKHSSHRWTHQLVADILKRRLEYSYRQAPVCGTDKLPEGIEEEREVYRRFIRLAIVRGCNFIFIDESAFSPRNLMNRTWVSKTNPVKIERPINVGSCHLISGLSTFGETFTVVRTEGANTRLEFLNYLILLDKKLLEVRANRRFKEKLVLVFDNAPIHKSIEI